MDAVATEEECCQTTEYQEEVRLLPPSKRATDCGLQLAAQRAEVLRGDLAAHVDDGHRRQGPALGAMRQLQQVLASRERGGVGRDAGRGAARHQDGPGPFSQPTGNRWRVGTGGASLLEPGRLPSL